MSIPDKYTVQPIKKFECKDWLLGKHYARRMPPISYAYGLFDINRILQGVCTFGIPASRFEGFGQPYELNRLVVNEDLEKNVLSFFVSHCLNQFPAPNVIVSYADPNNGHSGYIYQATNWAYTGLSNAHNDWIINGQLMHEKSVVNSFGTSAREKLIEMGLNVETVKTLPKHRYFYFVGTRTERRKLRAIVLTKFAEAEYPKGDNRRYDASYQPVTQSTLF